MGGIESQVSGLVEKQKADGHDVQVLTLTAGSMSLEVRRFPFKLPKDMLWHPRGRSILKRELERLNPDVVHLHFGAVSPFAWQGLKVVDQLGIASVATVHSIWGKIAQTLYSLSARSWQTNTVFSSVSKIAADIVHRTLNREVHVVPNGVDVDFWKITSYEQDNHYEVVSATRFAQRKRIRAQIEVIEKVVNILGDKSPHFTIAGTGPDFQYIKHRIARLNLTPYVTLVGRVQKSELKDLYAKADMFLQMSVLEAFGIAACEARAAGLPVLTRLGSGVSEFVKDGFTGYLAESDEQIVHRLVELSNHPQSLTDLKLNSRNNPPIQSWQLASEEVMNLYQQAISKNNR